MPLVLAAMIIARNPTQYGLVFEVEAPVAYEKVKVPPAVDLRRVAEWTGSSIDHIQQLNPELRRWTTPVSDEYEVKVPAGTAEVLRAELASASSSELTSLKWHTVKRGESLQSIARKLKVSRTDLAEANGLRLEVKGAGRSAADHPAQRRPCCSRHGRSALRQARWWPRSPSPAPPPRLRAGSDARRHTDGLPGQARRHAVLDRRALRHHGREDQELEPPARQPNHRRRPLDDLCHARPAERIAIFTHLRR